MSADDDLDDVPAPLDPTRYARPTRPSGLRVIDGVHVRIVERLPEETVRDAVAWSFAPDVLLSS